MIHNYFTREQKRFFLVSLLALTVLVGSHISPAKADVPGIISVVGWASGTDTILNITVDHDAPTSSHYVDIIDIDIDGVVDTIYPSASIQNDLTVTHQYNMGVLMDTPSVKVRARCSQHGWSLWSSSFVVPEFSLSFILLILLLPSLVIIGLRSKWTASSSNV